VDWSDPESVIDYQLCYARVLAGDRRPFDEQTCRELAIRDVARARNVAALQHHVPIPDHRRSYEVLSSTTAPTLVIHGTADLMFPPRHGEALAAEISGAPLPLLEGAGHGVDQAD
jgi:pimeloyl-ACP methyl ester carboxylesterase